MVQREKEGNEDKGSDTKSTVNQHPAFKMKDSEPSEDEYDGETEDIEDADSSEVKVRHQLV